VFTVDSGSGAHDYDDLRAVFLRADLAVVLAAALATGADFAAGAALFAATFLGGAFFVAEFLVAPFLAVPFRPRPGRDSATASGTGAFAGAVPGAIEGTVDDGAAAADVDATGAMIG